VGPSPCAVKREIILLRRSTRTFSKMELLRGSVKKTDATQAPLLIPRWSSAVGPTPPTSHDPLDQGHVFAVEQRPHWIARGRPLDLCSHAGSVDQQNHVVSIFRNLRHVGKEKRPDGWNAPRIFELNEAEI